MSEGLVLDLVPRDQGRKRASAAAPPEGKADPDDPVALGSRGTPRRGTSEFAQVSGGHCIVGSRIIGFDSAWTDRPAAPGAVCILHVSQGGAIAFHEPELASFDRALALIREQCRDASYCLISLDQPSIVPNSTGMRPVDRVAASLVSYVGGGVQPANRSKQSMFGEAAPLWRFKAALGAIEDPELARTAVDGVHLIEVFPALALPALEPAFGDRLKGPRYNPARRRTFREQDWRAVAECIARYAASISCSAMAHWARGQAALATMCKADQDRLDAVLCAIIGYHWRFAPRAASIMIGDLASGYMVSPTSAATGARLRLAAGLLSVPIDGGPADRAD